MSARAPGKPSARSDPARVRESARSARAPDRASPSSAGRGEPMAAQKGKSKPRSRSSSSGRNGRRGGGRSASQKPEKYRFAQNVDGVETVAEEIYRRYAEEARKSIGVDPDVLIDVPVVKVDSIHLELD